MNYFQEIGQTIAEKWARSEYDQCALPNIAANVLQRSRPCDNVSYEDIARWVSTTNDLPNQPNLKSTFGEPPLTLWAHPRFYIEALFWITGTTAVHQHGFSGAFALLDGSSIQTRYQFLTDRRVNSSLLLGHLQLERIQLLRQGDVEVIPAGNPLIHSVFHLDTPSVTIVVRTPNVPECQPQYSYHKPFVATDPFYSDPIATRRVQFLDLFWKLKAPSRREITLRALEHSDLLGTYQILDRLGTNKEFASSPDEYLNIARTKYGVDVDKLWTVVLHKARELQIATLRGTVRAPHLRFFLALLLNLDAKEHILTAVKQKYSDEDPRALIATWVCELCHPTKLGSDAYRCNHELVRELLTGKSDETVIDSISQDLNLGIADKESLWLAAKGLRESTVLRPLFDSGQQHSDSVVALRSV